ncbi:PQQ-like beta-propeller repeat protein [Shimia sagamensis]|uniref:PQQ-like domain-containing protein n=1 Tax=Shimia sagamensis TaxID=1566352 RepID=A0ABY1PIR7_9RHOB|nr:PQQ-like beta-propeller repeat protein [Shimia sagamensis]SMP35237.1 PQQ-like domain-containing protein [Shimia sagamensis]
MKRLSWILTAGVASAALLSACAEPEIILVGDREDLIPSEEVIENKDLAISLPAQSNNAQWTGRIGTPSTRTANAALSQRPVLAWSTSIGAGESRKTRITADPVVAEGRIFTVDAEATVTATSSGGQLLWSRDMTPPNDKAGQASTGGLAYGKGKLFVTTGFGSIRALDPATGADLWEQKFQSVGSGTPTVYGDLVYVVSGDATAWALEVETGKIAWQMLSIPNVQNVQSPAAPAITDRLAIFPYGSGEIQAAFRRGGVSRWTAGLSDTRPGRAVNTVGDISGDPVVVGDTIYVANHSGRMAAFDAETGQRKWTAGQGALSPVFPAGGSLFLVSETNELLRLDARDGTRIWGYTLPQFVKDKPKKQSAVHAHYGPILAGGQLVVPSSDEVVRFYNPRNGLLTHTVELPHGAATNPVVAGGVLYVVNRKGELYAFR